MIRCKKCKMEYSWLKSPDRICGYCRDKKVDLKEIKEEIINEYWDKNFLDTIHKYTMKINEHDFLFTLSKVMEDCLLYGARHSLSKPNTHKENNGN